MNVEKISAITIKVNDMARSVHFYNGLLGLKVLYGGESAYFSSLQSEPREGPRDARLGADNFLCRRRRSVLGSPESRRPRTVICPANPLRLPSSFAISTNC
jgi:catechol 2,3-dioxygenase-like lactoylglutathione lyase family enzyme